MNEFLFKGSFPLHFSESLFYLHFKLIIFQLWCCYNSLATYPDVKSWDFCNSYLLCFSFALTHKMKFAFCIDRTTQSLRESNLFSKRSSVILNYTNTELSIGKEWSTFTLTSLRTFTSTQWQTFTESVKTVKCRMRRCNWRLVSVLVQVLDQPSILSLDSSWWSSPRHTANLHQRKCNTILIENLAGRGKMFFISIYIIKV